MHSPFLLTRYEELRLFFSNQVIYQRDCFFWTKKTARNMHSGGNRGKIQGTPLCKSSAFLLYEFLFKAYTTMIYHYDSRIGLFCAIVVGFSVHSFACLVLEESKDVIPTLIISTLANATIIAYLDTCAKMTVKLRR